MRAQVSNQCNWMGADLTALDSPGAPFLAYSNSGTLAGALVTPVMPPQVSIAISLRTGLSGRSYRGRVFFVGLPNSLTHSFGVVPGSTQTTYQGIWNALRTSLVTAGFQLCVLSLYSGVDGAGNKIPRAAGVATPVTSIIVGARLDTQRKRLPVEART